MPDEDDLIAAKEALRRAQLEAALAAERVERLSDEELLAEAAAEGIDVPVEAARVRGVLAEAVKAVPCPHPEHRISVPVNGRYTCMQCGHDVPRPRRPRRTAAAQPQAVRLDDLDYARFRNTMKNPPRPTAALVDVLKAEKKLGSSDCDPGPITPLVLAVHAERHSYPLAQAIGRAGSAHVFVIDNRPGKDPTPEPFPAEFFEVWPSTRTPGMKAVVEQQLTDYVAPPIRVSFCPACKAPQGARCEGFERWDECHIERVQAAMLRSLAK